MSKTTLLQAVTSDGAACTALVVANAQPVRAHQLTGFHPSTNNRGTIHRCITCEAGGLD